MQYLDLGLFPVTAPSNLTTVWKGKLQPVHWQEIIIQYKNNKSLRQLAKEYGVSYEGVRRTLRRIGMSDLV